MKLSHRRSTARVYLPSLDGTTTKRAFRRKYARWGMAMPVKRRRLLTMLVVVAKMIRSGSWLVVDGGKGGGR